MDSSAPTTLRVLFFGPVRAQLGLNVCALACAEPLSIEEFWSLLLTLHPELKPFRPTLRLARGSEFLAPDARLQAGEEVALIPPVSGG